MNLAQFLEKYEHISLADSGANAEVLEFFNSLEMNVDNSEIFYDRSPDFFSFLKSYSGKFFVLLLKDKNEELKGVGTLIVTKAFLNGNLTKVCYLGDLRVSSLKMTVYWRKFYSNLIFSMPSIEEFQDTSLCYTAILDDNKTALKALTDSRADYQYEKIFDYNMINIIGPSPFFRSSLEANLVKDLSEVENFMLQENQKRALGLDMFDFFNYRMDHWEQFKERIICVKKKGEILAVCGLWSPYEHKKIRFSSLPLVLPLFYHFARALKAHPLLKDTLRPLYLCGLTLKSNSSPSDQSEALQAILKYVFDSEIFKEYHTLTFADSKVSYLKAAYRWCYHQKTPAAIYQVFSKKRGPKLNSQRLGEQPLHIELALI